MKTEKYFISVGEPWNFESSDGQNIIEGNILGILSDQCLVFKTSYYLKFGEITGNILILTPRYKDHDFSILTRELVVVNGSVLLKDYDDALTEKELRNNAKFEIVGSIRKSS